MGFPINPNLQRTEAGATFSAEGEKVSKGKEKLRFKVMGENGDNRMQIAAKQSLVGPDMSAIDRMRNHFRASRYVRYGDVDLNIRSLAKRLHLTEATIREAAKSEGGVGSLIEAGKEQQLDKALNHYEKIFVHRDQLAKQGLSTHTLMNVTKIGLAAVLKEAGNSSPSEGKLRAFSLEKHVFHVDITKQDPDALSITVLGRKLGSGAFGMVLTESPLDNPEIQNVVKLASSNSTFSQEVKNQSLKNEVKILETFEDPSKGFHVGINGKVIGIEETPRLYTALNGKNEVSACRKQLMDGDLNKAFNATQSEKMQIARQLLAGGANLVKANIAHADIKPDNILVKKEADGRWTACISDFGSAKRIPNTDKVVMSDTNYVPKALINRFDDVALAARDRFAMGKTLFNLFTEGKSTDAFSYGGVNVGVEVDLNTTRGELEKAGVPKNMQETILGLLDVDSKMGFEEHRRALPLSVAKEWGEFMVKARFAARIYEKPRTEGLSRREAKERKGKAGALLHKSAINLYRLQNEANTTFDTSTGRIPPFMRKPAIAYGEAKLAFDAAVRKRAAPEEIGRLRQNLMNAERTLAAASQRLPADIYRPADVLNSNVNQLINVMDRLISQEAIQNRKANYTDLQKEYSMLVKVVKHDASKLFTECGKDKKLFAKLCPDLNPDGTHRTRFY